MSLIIAARFSTFMEAENAAKALISNSFPENEVSVFFVSPPGQNHAHRGGGDEFADPGARFAQRTALIGAGIGGALGAGAGFALVTASPDIHAAVSIIGAGIGAYCGSLMGALSGMRNAQKRSRPGRDTGVRHSGVMVAVNATPDNEMLALQLLKSHGGKDVERANGFWRDGKWADFNPVNPPVLSDKVPPAMA
jgi:hypothetical protein